MIFKSKLPEINIPNIDIPQYCINEGKRRHAQNPNSSDFAICDGPSGKKLTIYDIESQSKQLASGFANKYGFGKEKDGFVVAVFSPNMVYYPVVVFGILMAGGIATLANPTYTARELAFQLKDSNSQFVVTQKAFLETTIEAIKISGQEIPHDRIILVDVDQTEVGGGPVHIERVYCDIPIVPYTIGTEKEASERVAILPYSSGTTGLPKGVMLTHKNIVTCAEANNTINYSDGYYEGKYPSRFMGVLPFYHIYGFTIVLLIGIASASGIVVVPKFEISNFLSLIEKYRVTFAHLVPPIIVHLLNSKDSDKYDLSSLKHIMTGAAPLGDDVLSQFKKMYKGIYLIVAYGMTETSPTVTSRPKNHPSNGSVGLLINATEAKVVDEDGNELGYNQVGELCFRGPNVMKGYLNNPKATSESIDSDGFMHTGDIGFVDNDENFHVVDRKKELIKFKGFQVAPAELESLLLTHDDVADSAVIGIYNDEQATEFPKAYITLASNHDGLSPEKKIELALKIKEWLDNDVAPHKRLRGGIEILDVIPKSASGKILRRNLREIETLRKTTKTQPKL
ncbi:hypothetical protein BB558_007351 [Smittium angustum]|uniref:AMP-dependent synthetase/ligase domain-containing protein n=1 Tax=Smittium angustum TaxID=133377 RepID=A0A2U1IV80_SMIAN|nr:hypothetical protein BB558_007351 [Smittium angustum]